MISKNIFVKLLFNRPDLTRG